MTSDRNANLDEANPAADCAASAMLQEVIGGLDRFESPSTPPLAAQPVPTAPRLPDHFVDQDYDGLS